MSLVVSVWRWEGTVSGKCLEMLRVKGMLVYPLRLEDGVKCRGMQSSLNWLNIYQPINKIKSNHNVCTHSSGNKLHMEYQIGHWYSLVRTWS